MENEPEGLNHTLVDIYMNDLMGKRRLNEPLA